MRDLGKITENGGFVISLGHLSNKDFKGNILIKYIEKRLANRIGNEHDKLTGDLARAILSRMIRSPVCG